MTTWLLALVLMASLAGLGYRQGAIRVAFSFLGVLMGALLAAPLGKLLKPILVAIGVKNPVLLWLLGAPIVFILISIIFKVAALAVHQKVDVYYKYQAGDLRLALWERLNARLGLCLGPLNGLAYLVLIAMLIYPFSYWTVQLASSDKDPKWMRLLNQAGRDLQSTGFIKVSQALNPMPRTWYDAADLGGLLYQNPLLEARLPRYPAFLDLAERAEFQDMATDKAFIELRQRQEPVMTVLDNPKSQAVLQNPELLQAIWKTVVPDMKDFYGYLNTTGAPKSPKYDPEKILGRWKFNVGAAIANARQRKPNISPLEMKKVKAYMLATFSRTSMVAKPDHQVALRDAPPLAQGGSGPALQTSQGKWESLDGGKYQLAFSGLDVPASTDGERLTLTAAGVTWVFDRADGSETTRGEAATHLAGTDSTPSLVLSVIFNFPAGIQPPAGREGEFDCGICGSRQRGSRCFDR